MLLSCPYSNLVYNGWTNYETWNVKRWLGKEPSTSDYWLDRARKCFDNAEADNTFSRKENASFDLRDILKAEIRDANPLTDASMYNDLLGAALSAVSWQEISESLLVGIEEDFPPNSFEPAHQLGSVKRKQSRFKRLN